MEGLERFWDEQEVTECDCICKCKELSIGGGQCTECFYSHR